MTQAFDVLVTRTRDGRFRARLRWNDGVNEREEALIEQGVIALMVDVGRAILTSMERTHGSR